MYVTPQRMDSVKSIAGLVAAAQSIPINGRTFIISNTGAQPLYINPDGTATATSFLIPAGVTLPIVFSCLGNLSVISNATGTSVSVMYLDI
jgi:hypothetical protein